MSLRGKASLLPLIIRFVVKAETLVISYLHIPLTYCSVWHNLKIGLYFVNKECYLRFYPDVSQVVAIVSPSSFGIPNALQTSSLRSII